MGLDTSSKEQTIVQTLPSSICSLSSSSTTRFEEDMLERLSNLEELVKEASRLANPGSNILKDCREISESIVAASVMKKEEIPKAAHHQMINESDQRRNS